MAQHSPPPTLATLPDEILQSIAHHLDAPSLTSLGLTARRFIPLANEPLLWKRFCQREFRFWRDRAAFRAQVRDTAYRDWKQRYGERRGVTAKARNALDKVVFECRGRGDRIRTILEHGWEAKDALVRAFQEAAGSPVGLALRYWSHVALGCLHRTVALEQWIGIRDGAGSDDGEDVVVRALAALDLFVLDQEEKGDVDDVCDRLEWYVGEVRAAYPDLHEQTPRTIAMTVASYLRERRWVGMDEGRPYYSLDNMFLGVALFSAHNNSLPLVSAVIYCYVVQRFGLRARPINYPMHVFVLVQPPPSVDIDGRPRDSDGSDADYSPKTHLYMDPFRGIEPVPMEWFNANTRFVDASATPAQAASYMTPASHRDLLIRSAHNILNSQARDTSSGDAHRISSESATYAAFFALTLFPNHPVTLRTYLSELTKHFLHHFEHDLHVFRTYIVPLTSSLADHVAYRDLCAQLEANDNEAPVPKLRTQSTSTSLSAADPDLNLRSTDLANATVTYRVGQLFRHRVRHYLALIYGWDPTCRMTQQWITLNQVDRLPRGRRQPFYHVLVIDDRSTRYVAEENVELLGPVDQGGNGEMVSMDEVEKWPIEIGRWMKRFLVARRDARGNGLGWAFESNVKEEYPED